MRTLSFLLVTALCASPAPAWDRFGHMVVDAIAWEHMSEALRGKVTAVLSKAPADSDLTLAVWTPRELFLRAGYWPDIVRDEAWPARKEKYDHPAWHYVNHFWRNGRLLPEMGTAGELIERLERLTRVTPDAIDMAWIQHLTGDIHQPLHSSARVSARDPEGDRGGNNFELSDPEVGNLHAFWDTILRRAVRKRHSESYPTWLTRVSERIMATHSRESFEWELQEKGVSAWSRAGAELAMAHAYPEYLIRGGVPSRLYRDEALELAERQIALAGYRLASILEALLNQPG